MKKFIKGRRIIFNPSANDFNDEPEYKLQKVRIYGESNSKKSYIISFSFGSTFFWNVLFLNAKRSKRKV